MTWKRGVGVALFVAAILAVGTYEFVLTAPPPQVHTIAFRRGADLPQTALAEIAAIAGGLRDVPAAQVTVVGHTGTRGDPAANLQLGAERATAVRDALIEQGVAPDRLQTRSAGGAEPLPQEPGETETAWQRRLARVEVVITRSRFPL